MRVMRINENSSAVALLAFLVAAYPLMIVASLLSWSWGVQFALAIFGVVVLIGVKLALVVRDRRRARPPR